MKWEVTGADSISGAERTILVEAANQEDAQVEANFKGIVAASIEAADGEENSGSETESDAESPPNRERKKRYFDLPAQAKTLDVVSSIFSGIGYVLLLVGVIDLVCMVLAVMTHWARPSQLPYHFAFVGAAVIGCFVFQGGAAALRMFASIGLAVQDIALEARRNRKQRLGR